MLSVQVMSDAGKVQNVFNEKRFEAKAEKQRNSISLH